MLETTRIRKEGYSYRPTFFDFLDRYKLLGFGVSSTPPPNEATCRRIMEKGNINGFQIGKTKVSSATMYKLMVSSIAPRPVALVTTLNEDGSPNLAPISWYQMVSQDPAMVMISFGGSEDRRKDSENNIKRLNEFSISSSSEPYAEALNFASVDCPSGISEYALSGTTTQE